MRKTYPDNGQESSKPLIAHSNRVAYDIFAPYYDHYMQHVDYDKWTEKILSIYHQHNSEPLRDILELACGTANISERLVRMGYQVTASDRSEEMLKYASQKEFKPLLIQADMTDEITPDAFDMIILVFDSINYLLDQDKIMLMLDHVSKGLRHNGIFIFDISTYKNSIENFNEYLNIDEDRDYLLIHKAEYDHDHRLQKTKLTIFQRSDNHYIREDEEHTQRVYYVHELLSLCEQSPLNCVGIYSASYEKNLLRTNSRKLDHQFSRLFFALKKM